MRAYPWAWLVSSVNVKYVAKLWMVMEVFSFDIDGTLVNSYKRLIACTKNDAVDWECFLDCNKLYMDEPIESNISLMNRLIMSDAAVILVTGRPKRMRGCTLAQLRGFGALVDDVLSLIMRDDDDHRPDPPYKVDALSSVRHLGDLIHCDDNVDTVNALIRNGFRAVTADACGSLYASMRPHNKMNDKPRPSGRGGGQNESSNS
ncbi:MAG: acid phosphatase [Thermocladium sp.]